jgi:hypothetical protein
MTEMTRETKELFARRYSGAATTEDVIDWAVSLLEVGISTKSVAILAGQSPRYPSEVEAHFARSLSELGWQVPEREESLRWFVRSTATKILSNEINPREGCKRIYEIASAPELLPEMARWVCLYLGHDPDPPCDDLSGEKYDEAVRREAKLITSETHANS